MILRHAFTAAAIAIGAAALAPATAEATSFKELTLNERADLSDYIVRGTVSEIWTEPDPDGRIWTRAQLDISDVYKGDPSLDGVVIDQLGGAWADQLTTVAGAARFSLGEEIIVFLDVSKFGTVRPVGMHNGKWTVRIDPYSHLEIVQRFTQEQSKPYDHRFIPLPREDARLLASDFESQIRTATEAPGVK